MGNRAESNVCAHCVISAFLGKPLPWSSYFGQLVCCRTKFKTHCLQNTLNPVWNRTSILELVSWHLTSPFVHSYHLSQIWESLRGHQGLTKTPGIWSLGWRCVLCWRFSGQSYFSLEKAWWFRTRTFSELWCRWNSPWRVCCIHVASCGSCGQFLSTMLQTISKKQIGSCADAKSKPRT